MNLPISIHTREALEDTYQILKEEDVRDIGGIMHSFSGDYEWAKRFLDLGMHISFSGVVTFKKALDVKRLQQMYQSNDYLWKQMPLIWHQFLLEESEMNQAILVIQ